MTIFRNVIKWIMAIILAAIIITLSLSLIVVSKASGKMLTLEEIDVDDYDCVIVLGAGYRDNYQPSPMLKDRMDIGIKAFQAGKADKLLLSGDSMDPQSHDEIKVMYDYSVSNGISQQDILTDPYGLSTYESMWRARNVFNAEKVIVITQKYHLYRAVYIGNQLGIETVGIACDQRDYGVKMIWYTIREVIARCKDYFWCISQPDALYPN